jgi:hypothetical protein
MALLARVCPAVKSMVEVAGGGPPARGYLDRALTLAPISPAGQEARRLLEGLH